MHNSDMVTTRVCRDDQWPSAVHPNDEMCIRDRAWIDYNSDGDFGDVDEFLGASPDVDANGTASFSFEVPVSAANGTTRMRVIGGNDSAILATQFCGASGSNFGRCV